MNRSAVDLFAEENPAFCAICLSHFCQAFQDLQPTGVDWPIMYLPLPLCLSTDIADTFDGTNKKTGLFSWIQRNPKIQSGISDRIEMGFSTTADAIRFGVLQNILAVNKEGRVVYSPLGYKKKVDVSVKSKAADAIKRSQILGFWMAEVRSTESIFNVLGVAV